MKGIAHFISGVTVASFCPWAVEAAQNGNPVYFILGAVAGILPDTIDFKFYRFFYKHDIRVEPQPYQLDPQPIADAVAQAVSLAMEGKRATLKLASIKLGADDWRQYSMKIDPEAGEVQVQFGPIVSTGQVPQPDSMPDPRPVAIAKFDAPILQSYEPTYTVDIFDGPSFAFQCNEAGQVEIDFLPWHRNGSHSLTVGALLAGIASFWTWKAGVVVFGAYVIHVIEDQLGHMGSNLFFPITKKRAPGLKLMRSGDAFPNFAGVWLCCLLIFWNLYAGIENPLYHFTFIRLIMTAMMIPFAIFGAGRWLLLRLDGEG
ncbi:MAG: metal-dependent hydrolase [Kiritimatiellales bacterium]|nr:metal-dependent hydrolase [Kiritimatiellota bacterium]MBL7012135.1 metal-dependent hydrolase [Kiritimatiellales bacterium]